MEKKFLALIVTAAMLLSLAACGSADEHSSTGKSQNEQNAEDGTIAASYLFTDDVGRQVEIPSEITRIVPSAPLAQIILMAIAPEMFVGLAAKLDNNTHGIIPENLFEIPYFGSLYAGPDLNVEELALPAPQIIIDIGEPKDSTKEDLDSLQEQTLIPSIYISASLEGMPETYRKLGKLLGKEEKGQELAAFCERIYDRTLSIMNNVGENKVSCLYVLGEEGLNVIASSSYHAELLDLLTNNVAVVDNPISKGNGNEVTMEQISIWNPEFVIFGPDSIYSTVKDIETWNQLDAIVNGQYMEVPDVPHNWMSMPPAVQRYLGLIWLTAELYPEYCNYDVKAEILEYFELFYGCKLTNEQYDAITANAFLK